MTSTQESFPVLGNQIGWFSPGPGEEVKIHRRPKFPTTPVLDPGVQRARDWGRVSTVGSFVLGTWGLQYFTSEGMGLRPEEIWNRDYPVGRRRTCGDLYPTSNTHVPFDDDVCVSTYIKLYRMGLECPRRGCTSYRGGLNRVTSLFLVPETRYVSEGGPRSRNDAERREHGSLCRSPLTQN